MTTAVSSPQLKKTLGLGSVVVFGTDTAIGVSIFSVFQPAALQAGSGLLIAILLAAIPMVFFGLSYAYLASADPRTGASYEWPRRYLSPIVGFLVVWMRLLTNVGAITVLGLVLVNYLSMVIALPLKPTMALIFTLVFGINLLGAKSAARAQLAMMAILVIMLGIFVTTGFSQGSVATVGPLFEHSWLAILGAVPLLISLFLGIETAVEMGGEIKDAERTIPKGIVLAILLTAVIYSAVAYVALALIGPQALATSDAPLFDAGKVAMGDWALLVIVGAATVSILTTVNALAAVFSRTLYALGQSHALPAVLGKVSGANQTPRVAILTAYALVMCGLFLPSSLTFLLLAVNIPTMFKYMACSAAAVQVVRKFPQVSARAQLKFSAAFIKRTSLISVLLALVVILLGLSADWRPYVLIGAWLLIGFIFWRFYARQRVLPVSSEQANHAATGTQAKEHAHD